MMEVPSAGQVHEISQSLFNSIERGGEYRQELEVLSSLAQRQSSVFEPAKLLFAEAVNLLTHSEEASGTSALESVLAANPEVAVTIIPALRAHGSEELRRAGVRLLRDIETEEAIDQLFQILGGPDGPEKSEAAWVISDLVATRKDELIERASLLPPDENLAIWPIETYLPSRLAVPIARALSPEIETGDSAINLAARAAREIQKGAGGDTRFLRQWRNVLRDVRLARIRTVFAATLMNVGLWSAVIGVVAILALAVWARTTDRTLVLQIDPLNLQPADTSGQRLVIAEGDALIDLIEDRYPADARGIARLLPQNWEVERQLPPDIKEKYRLLNKQSNYMRSLSNLQQERLNLMLVRPEDASLRRALNSSNAEWWPTDGYFLSIRSIPLVGLVTDILAIVMMPIMYYVFFRRFRRVSASNFSNIDYPTRLIFIVMATFLLCFTWLTGSMLLRLALPAVVAGLLLSKIVFSSVRWPANRFTDIVRDLI